MVLRNIVKIDEEKCNGCGLCVNACAEGAIKLINGKAKLVSESCCDGLGACIGHCPEDAITVEQREADPFDEAATAETLSRLSHWPVQLKLVSPTAPYFANADLLLVADCVPFAMGDFHSRILRDRSIAVGCPKLDDAEFYIEKLSAILKANKPKSLTVVHMKVPCCFGLTRIAREAVSRSGLKISFEDVTVDLRGNITNTQSVEPGNQVGSVVFDG